MERQGRYIKEDFENKMKQKECPECGSDKVFAKKELNQIICNDCGAIVEEFAPEEKKKSKKVRKQ